MISTPLFPDRSAQPARCLQDVVARIRTAAIRLPELGVFAGRDDGIGGARSDGVIAVFRVVCTIATDAGNVLASRNLIEQSWQNGGATDTIVSHFHGSDLERGGVDPKVHLAPLAAIVGAMLFRLPLAFAKHLDARTVYQQMQTCRGRYGADGNLQRFLAPAYRTVIGHRPIETGKLQQALRHAYSQAQRQTEETLDAQAELDCLVTKFLAASSLASRLAMPVHVRIKPDEQ